MNVNLKVLTGSQAGNLRSLNSNTIWISQDENQQISISRSAPRNSLKSAVLTKVDSAWVFEPRTGTEWHVGGQKITLFSKTRIKSGSAIRLSWAGPDINFAIGEKVAEVWPKPEPIVKKPKQPKKPTSRKQSAEYSQPVGASTNPEPVYQVPAPPQPGSQPVQQEPGVSKSYTAQFSPTFPKGDRNWLPLALIALIALSTIVGGAITISSRSLALKEAEAKIAESEENTARLRAQETKEIADLEKKMEENRKELYELIINKRDEDKRNAELDLKHVTEDKKLVKDDLASKTQLIDRRINDLKIRQKSRETAVQGFAETRKPQLNLNIVGKRVAKLASYKKKRLEEITNGPIEANLGSIASGKGLNLLLEKLGPLASDQADNVKELRADIEVLQEIVDTQNQIPIPGEGYSEVELDLKYKKVALTLLEDLQGSDLPERVKRLYFKGGPFETSVRQDLQNGPLHIEWRWFAMLDGFEFEVYKNAIEANKKVALKQISEGEFVEPEILLDLWKARDQFTIALKRFRKDNISKLPFEHHQQQAYDDAREEHKKMCRDIKHLNDINSLDYLQPSEKFEGTTINDLLAYMNRNSMEFEEELSGGSPATRENNALIYKEMLNYQFSMLALLVAVESEGQYDTSGLEAAKGKLESAADKELNRLNDKEDMLLDVKYDSYLKLAREAQSDRPGIAIGNPLGDILVEGVKGFANGFGFEMGEQAAKDLR